MQPCCTHTHMCTHVHTHSEMSVILPSASLTVSMASMASMVAEGWAKRKEKRRKRGHEEREDDRVRERR